VVIASVTCSDIASVTGVDIASVTGVDIALVTDVDIASVTGVDICVGIALVVGADIGTDAFVGDGGANSSRIVLVVCPVDEMVDVIATRFSAELSMQSGTPWLADNASTLHSIVSNCRWKPAWTLSISTRRPYNVDRSAKTNTDKSCEQFRINRLN